MFSHFVALLAAIALSSWLPQTEAFRPFTSFVKTGSTRMTLQMETATPGAPVILKMDEARNCAIMQVTIPGDATQRAFTKACDLFNEEVKARGYKVDGFRKGAKLPPNYLYQMFGEDKVKVFCGTLLSEDIQDQCEKTGLMFVGRGRITDFQVSKFVPGQPHTIDIECDLWPKIDYGLGYKGLEVSVAESPKDLEKINAVKKSIMERYKVLGDVPAGYAAQAGDSLTVNMQGFEKLPSGEKGAPLPAIASGDQVQMILEKGKFMDGLIEGLIGAQAGDSRTVSVTFPKRVKGPAVDLSGKEAIFDVKVLSVKSVTLPKWDEELAKTVRDGMTLEELNAEVEKAVESNTSNNQETNRNDALAKALLDRTKLNLIPESLVEENTQAKFQEMLMDFKEQGSTQEQISEMATPEKYERYKEISRPNVEKIVTLGMAFRDIAEKEKISVDAKEIQEQVDMINAQARQRGEQPPDERRARDEIENVLLRKKVFDFLAANAKITWLAPEEEPKAQN